MDVLKVGIIGCGKISEAYFQGIRRYALLQVVACADQDVERAIRVAREQGIAKGCSVAELLADGRPYLCGERFGAADLTFAALSAAVIVPSVYGTPLPQPELLPAEIAALVCRARDHPAGRFALRMIAEQRHLVPGATAYAS